MSISQPLHIGFLLSKNSKNLAIYSKHHVQPKEIQISLHYKQNQPVLFFEAQDSCKPTHQSNPRFLSKPKT
jgi:hypothetical protein